MTTTQGQSPPILASVVVVSWMLVDELRACLDSLLESVDAPPFEVIVVLNGAPAAAGRIARDHPVVSEVIVRAENVGFGAASNLGADRARGKYVVFLNDDTRVDKHWLKNLVKSAEEHQRAVVASLLLNFDGTVQEAGSRLLSHGGTVQLGKGLELANAAEIGLITAREVDYGSAAALLVQRDLFRAVGGFDPLFEPAYFEDVDLQLRIRERGHSVWFEPEAKVLHYSGKSTSHDTWFKHFAANHSGHHFVQRWSHLLASAPAPDDPVSELCEVPRQQRPSARGTSDEPTPDNSSTVALRIARAYEEWLVDRLEDQQNDVELARGPLPPGPSRRELLLHNQLMGARVADLERRGLVGIAKMRIGLFLLRARNRRETPDPS